MGIGLSGFEPTPDRSPATFAQQPGSLGCSLQLALRQEPTLLPQLWPAQAVLLFEPFRWAAAWAWRRQGLGERCPYGGATSNSDPVPNRGCRN
jgi:hypothetical protein